MTSSSFLPAFCRPVGRMRARALPAACAAALLSLAACGGGGSGTPAGSDQSVRITEQNAQPIVSNAFQAADSLYGIGLDASGTTLDLKDAGQRRKASMIDLALQRLELLGGAAAGSSVRSTKAVSSESLACEGGGSITLTMDDADGSGDASTGDSAYFDFANCTDAGWAINGRMSLTGLIFTGAPGDATRSLGADIMFNAFSISDGSETEVVHGGFSIRASLQTVPTQVVTSKVTGSSFRVSGTETDGELRSFVLDAHADASSGTYGYSIGATVIDSRMATVVVISNPEPFTGTVGAYPSAGSLLVSESGGSAAKLTALSSTNVRIDVDADGDGIFESTMDRTWSDIAGG